MRVAVTGAKGFVGKVLVQYLRNRGIEVVPIFRRENIINGKSYKVSEYTDIELMSSKLIGIDIVVHLAGLAHQDENKFSLKDYIEANVNLTKAIAESAKKAKVNRFIFISSIAVNGDCTQNGKAYSESDLPSPVTFYGKSKYMAEEAIRSIFAKSDTDYVILRPPLIYGPTCPGNFKRLLEITSKTFILPFGGVKNKRSFIYINNLTDVIFRLLSLPEAANEIYITSDKETYSLNEIIKVMLQEKFGNKAINLYIPTVIFEVLFKVLGIYHVWLKFSTELVVDSHKLTTMLKWQPPFTALEGFKRTVGGYKLDA